MNAVYGTLHWILISAYLVAPLALVIIAAARIVYAAKGPAVLEQDPEQPSSDAAAGQGADSARGRILLSMSMTLVAGGAIGGALALIYAQFIAGSVRAISAGQFLLCAYAGIGLIALLKSFGWLLQWAIGGLRGRYGWTGQTAGLLGLFARLLVLIVFMLPFSMAATMTFRPKVVPGSTPLTELGVRFDNVEFRAADGTRIAGWWIPAHAKSRRADETVVVVHGLGSGKADVLPMAAAMSGAGYNVLTFDLRAHGQSGGQFTSFGVKERLDVEAAAAWVKRSKPESCARLLGLGSSMGAAALLAARDEGDGSPFDAVAVLGTYDDLGALAREIVRQQFWGPLAYAAQWTALPAASAHAGVDLMSFRPADLAQGVYPSPLLVGHGERDEMIPYESGVRLYNAAFEPKRSLWVPDLGHNQVLIDAPTLEAVLGFFEDAKRAPRGVA